MAYTVIIENKAQKEFLRLSPPHDKALQKAIESLENEPRPQGVKKLVGTRVGIECELALTASFIPSTTTVELLRSIASGTAGKHTDEIEEGWERGLRPIHRRQPFESLRVLNEVEGEPAPTGGSDREGELAPTGTIFFRSLRWSISSRPSCYPVLIVILRMLGGEPTDKHPPRADKSLSVPPECYTHAWG